MSILEIDNPMSIENATARASKWVEAARPVILTVFDLEAAQERIYLASESNDYLSHWRSLSTEPLQTAIDELRIVISNTRDDFMSEETPKCPSRDDDDDAWDALEAFTDELERSVPNVAAAYRMIRETI